MCCCVKSNTHVSFSHCYAECGQKCPSSKKTASGDGESQSAKHIRQLPIRGPVGTNARTLCKLHGEQTAQRKGQAPHSYCVNVRLQIACTTTGEILAQSSTSSNDVQKHRGGGSVSTSSDTATADTVSDTAAADTLSDTAASDTAVKAKTLTSVDSAPQPMALVSTPHLTFWTTQNIIAVTGAAILGLVVIIGGVVVCCMPKDIDE
eukprot:Blabericola_migrator_1__10105@NODE_560_length_7594_cov_42_214694_g420_i0_p5_GENE_NODE_560_length_7594_cov_42_214694_g420_i0NODE_560_length_7594_cov_42_214694_g420_i0_p5_ORF_typecomplete_len206_score38_35CsgG/PF03783_14/0_059_NODE_560_length_7594_cov_42_214694_g420_i057674